MIYACPILHLTIHPSLPKHKLETSKMLFLLNFFEIQKTDFSILPMQLALSEAD